jgi:hypothetical protein
VERALINRGHAYLSQRRITEAGRDLAAVENNVVPPSELWGTMMVLKARSRFFFGDYQGGKAALRSVLEEAVSSKIKIQVRNWLRSL